MLTSPLIYLVDDSADYRFIMKQIFSRFLSHYSVRFFESGHKLLEALTHASEKPDVILLDRHMPDLDGHQTLLRLKQDAALREIPVVMMSADASTAEVEDCYRAGANSFLQKSTDFNALRNIMTVVCQYWLDFNWRPAMAGD